MCFPCWPVKDIILEDDDDREQRENQMFQHVWNGHQWIPRVGNAVSSVFSPVVL